MFLRFRNDSSMMTKFQNLATKALSTSYYELCANQDLFGIQLIHEIFSQINDYKNHIFSEGDSY